jgi:hypothetical protein
MRPAAAREVAHVDRRRLTETERADHVLVRRTVTAAGATVQVLGADAQVGNGVFLPPRWRCTQGRTRSTSSPAPRVGRSSSTTITVTRPAAHKQSRFR